jgi:rhodanese-related sulfurtransferase
MVRPVRWVASVTPEEAWELLSSGQARLLDLRTSLERRRYGWPPCAEHASLAAHTRHPLGDGVIYLCQHANRSKLTGRNGAPEVEGGFVAWMRAGLPIAHD